MRTRDSEKQQRIKEAMVRLILEEGMSGASVSKIAREAGVSPATIYIYYTSKEEMISEVFREYSHKSYHYLLRQIRPEMSGADLIDTIVRSSYRYFVENEEIFSFLQGLGKSTESVAVKSICKKKLRLEEKRLSGALVRGLIINESIIGIS